MNDELEKRAEAVIDQLLSLPPTGHAAAIERACAGDAKLFHRVQSLLSALPAVDNFLADVTVDAATEAPVTETSGSTIGRYKLLQQIGEGGFGVVFMAEQEKPVRRQVALKVIKLGMDTREVVARFEAERQALAMMDHPNIAKVLDAGSTESGRPYFVMELVRGSPITEFCDKRKMPASERIALIAQVCRAVQHAHSKGVIHRDIKPGNVLVSLTDDRPVPKVIDFGIAKATQTRLTDKTLYTAFRQMIGTPQYMSPEQADSDGVDVDTRTDVYSLGVLLYELLVGTTPFDARQLRSAAYDAMRKMIREQELPKPSTRLSGLGDTLQTVAVNRGTNPRLLSQIIRGELDWIVMRALEKERSRRYDTPSAMADDLDRYLNGEAVAAGPPGGIYRLKKIARRYKTALAVSALVGVVLLLGIIGTTYGLVRESRQRKVVEKQKTVAETQERRALAIVNFLTQDLLQKASPRETRDKAVSDKIVDMLIRPALATASTRFADEPLVLAILRTTLANVLFDLDRPELALPVAHDAMEAHRALNDLDTGEGIVTITLYAKCLLKTGQSHEATRYESEAWDRSRRVLGPDAKDTILAEIGHAAAVFQESGAKAAEEPERASWERCHRVLGDDDENTTTALNNYALVLQMNGKDKQVLEMEKAAFEHMRDSRGVNDPRTIDLESSYAGLLEFAQRPKDAEPFALDAWTRAKAVLGDEHETTINALGIYAGAMCGLRRAAEVELPLRNANAIMARIHPDSPLRGFILMELGQCLLLEKTKNAEAEQVVRQLIAWQKTHPDPTRTASNQALLNACIAAQNKPRPTTATRPTTR